MRFGIIFLSKDVRELVELARRSEEMGFDFIGVVDSQSVYRELYVSLALVAEHTRRARIGPAVTNPQTRHPAVTASAMATLQEISGGRAVLGLASGDSAVYNLGLQMAPLQLLREYVEAVRALRLGRSVPFRGAEIHTRWVREPFPVWLAAEGPRTLRLAGELADGVICGMGLTQAAVEVSLTGIATGARAAGRDPASIEKWFFVKSNLGPDRQTALDEIRMGLAGSANHVFRKTLAGKAVPPELAEPIRQLQAAYAFHEHNVQGGENATLSDRFGLTGYLAERFAIAGNVHDCIERVEQLAGYGVENLLLTALNQRPLEFIEIWGREIIPRFRR